VLADVIGPRSILARVAVAICASVPTLGSADRTIEPLQAHAPAAPTLGSVSGRVTVADCGDVPAVNVSVTLDGGLTATTDNHGVYRFDRVSAAAVPGLNAGEHVLVAASPDARTKIIRITPASCAEPCATLDFTVHRRSGQGCARTGSSNAIDAVDESAGAVIDLDHDGIDDGVEDWLGERFAPIIYHAESETNYPVSVDWLLKRTSLQTYDRQPSDGHAAPPVGNQTALLKRSVVGADGRRCDSDGTRSVCKRSGYYLADVQEPDRAGERQNARDWITYVHSYGNVSGGITIQYWRAYAYDQSKALFVDWGHGGDWEGIAVHLGPTLRPDIVSLLGHIGIDREPADHITWEGTHPQIWSEKGGHASRTKPSDLASRRFTRQETWTGGSVVWANGSRDVGGGALNVGEKRNPRNGQVFIQYSGLWGAPHRLFVTSGYWGPAFNETDAVCDDGRTAYRLSFGCGARNCGRIFHTAWCADMDGALLDRDQQCYAMGNSP
jgi:hypothetical protein